MRKLSVDDEKKIRKVLGANIAECRKRSKLTQEQLAEKSDTDRVTVAYAEIGKRIPKVTTLYQIAKVTNSKIGDLFKGL